MSVSSEVTTLMADFEKRMKFINIVRCVTDYTYPDAIRAQMPNKMKLDNIVIAVLLFIKDRTLDSASQCKLEDVENFLEELQFLMPFENELDCKEFARYIVVQVLQNGGVLREFPTFDSKTNTFKDKSIRLLNEEKESYHLTDDAFDFLFRSKEIESELDYSVTRFRMREYLKRNNYGEAQQASKDLVERIRKMKTSMDDFLTRCREDISKITIDQYDTIIGRIRALLETEYEELEDIRRIAKERAENLQVARESGVSAEETKKHRKALADIIQNIDITIDEQRSLINKKTSLSESYQALIQDSFYTARFERMHFEKDIMIPLRNMENVLKDIHAYSLFSLSNPEVENKFSVESFYASQSKISEDKDDDGLDVTAQETNEAEEMEKRNTRYASICTKLFAFMENRDSFWIGEFIDSLTLKELMEFSYEDALPHVLLTLFSMQSLDIASWNESEKVTLVPYGEFELSWCLTEMPEQYLQMKTIVFHIAKEIYSFHVTLNEQVRKIDITNFRVEVIR